VARRAGLQHRQRPAQVQPGLARQDQRLGAGGQHRQRQQVVDQLQRDPVAGRADVEDVAPHGPQHRRDGREIFHVGADHEEERPSLGLRRRAPHRRVDQADPARGQGVADRPRGGRGDRAAVHQDRAGARAGGDAVRAERRRLHVGAVRQHRDDDVRLRGDGARRRGHRRPGQRLGHIRVRVVDRQREAVPEQIPAHPAPHRAEPDQAEPLYHATLLSYQPPCSAAVCCAQGSRTRGGAGGRTVMARHRGDSE